MERNPHQIILSRVVMITGLILAGAITGMAVTAGGNGEATVALTLMLLAIAVVEACWRD